MSVNGWKEVKLGEVIQFDPKESLKKKQIAKKIAMDKLLPFSKNIDDYEISEYKGGKKFRNGDTLLARITPCLENGKTAQVTILDDEEEVGYGSTEFIVLRNMKNLTDNDYIFYLAISPSFREVAIKSMVGTSGRQRVQQDVLENLSYSFPPLQEQKAIAATLSCLDDKIELNNRMNQKLEEMAQALFKSWFVDFEPFQDGEFVDSELGRIPKGWRVEKIETLSKIIRGASPRPIQKFLSKSGMPWLKISDATSSSSKFLFETNQFIIEEGISKSRLVEPGTLILSNSATPGLPMIMAITACVHDGWLIFNDFMDISKEYLYYSLIHEREKILMLSNGSVFRNLKTSILKNYQIVVPPLKVIQEVTRIYKTINEEIKRNSEENQKLKELRNTLLPKLMSGEIRVPIPEVN